MMMPVKLATARQQIEKIAASPIMFHQCCCGVNAGERQPRRICSKSAAAWGREAGYQRRNKPGAPVLTSRLGSGGES
jgi:hypothetical protein